MGFVCVRVCLLSVCVSVCVCVCDAYFYVNNVSISNIEVIVKSKIRGENLGHNWTYKIQARVANYITP